MSAELLEIWRGECEAASIMVRNGEKFLMLPETSCVVIGTAIENLAALSRPKEAAPSEERDEDSFARVLSEFAVAVHHRQSEKARVLSGVLRAMYAATQAPQEP